MSALTGKHVLVLGLGESGLAMARWCVLRGARVRVADSRRVPPGRDALCEDAPLAELISGDFGAEVLDGVDLVALSPGLDPRVGVVAEARRRGLPVTGDYQAPFRFTGRIAQVVVDVDVSRPPDADAQLRAAMNDQ